MFFTAAIVDKWLNFVFNILLIIGPGLIISVRLFIAITLYFSTVFRQIRYILMFLFLLNWRGGRIVY